MITLGMFVAQSTLAYVVIAPAACNESCPDDDDERSCGCPLDCAKGCCAARVPAVAPTPILPDLLSPWSPAVLVLVIEREPPPVDPRELLRVPKTCA